ncbi:MAG: PTS mannitol transporter subunit IICBA [Spirochaetes bacterium]|nr:PTS mannitol transporter subunit IICBA [Spirochaetota bacterium]
MTSTSTSSGMSLKARIQKFGRFLSGMVMPNIGALLAWGFITTLFIPTGWLPNENLVKLVGPMLTYLIPMLIGYTGGKMVGGQRGGVAGAVATIGVIIGSPIPMILGAMMVGPLGGFLIKKFDNLIEGKIPTGFEMLVDTFSLGILGMVLALISFLVIGPVVSAGVAIAQNGVQAFVDAGLLPLASLLIEPGKILFLNNAINHGIFTPLGAAQVAETGKSIFFLLETNPGPGLGVLLAYFFFSKGSVKDSTPGAIIVHFFGGIHEIYFPYVMMHPILVLAVIGGGVSGVATNVLLGNGLSSAASPGSILAIMAVCPKGGHFGVLLSVIVACAVSFLISMFFVKRIAAQSSDAASLDSAKDFVKDMKNQSKGIESLSVKKIIFACDAGMGSSAMGASRLKKKLKAAGLDIDVIHCSVDDIPADAQLVICQKNLVERVKSSHVGVQVFGIDNFINAPEYDEVVKLLTN